MLTKIPTDLSTAILQILSDEDLCTVAAVSSEMRDIADACFSARGRILRTAWLLAAGDSVRTRLALPERTVGTSLLQSLAPKLLASDGAVKRGALDQVKRIVNISEQLGVERFGMAEPVADAFEPEALLRLSSAADFVAPPLQKLAEAMNLSGSTTYLVHHEFEMTGRPDDDIKKTMPGNQSLIDRHDGSNGTCRIMVDRALELRLFIVWDRLETKKGESFQRGLQRIMPQRTPLAIASSVPFYSLYTSEMSRETLPSIGPLREFHAEFVSKLSLKKAPKNKNFSGVILGEHIGTMRRSAITIHRLPPPIGLGRLGATGQSRHPVMENGYIEKVVELVRYGHCERNAGEHLFLNEQKVTGVAPVPLPETNTRCC